MKLEKASLPVYTLLIAVVLIPINIYWNVQMELVRYSGLPTTISLFFNVVFNLLVLSLFHAGMKRFWQKSLFKPGELVVIYTMLSIGSACCLPESPCPDTMNAGSLSAEPFRPPPGDRKRRFGIITTTCAHFSPGLAQIRQPLSPSLEFTMYV